MELLGKGGNVVGKGLIDCNVKCGMELNAVKLYPFEVAIWILEVIDGSVWTKEILGERLGQCVGLVIWWKRALVRNVGSHNSHGESSEGHNFSFPTFLMPNFEFVEEDIYNRNDGVPPSPSEDSCTSGSTSPLTKGSQCSIGNVLVLDGLPTARQNK